MSSSSYETSISSEQDEQNSDYLKDISVSDPDIAEAIRMTRRQEYDNQRYEKELMQSEKKAKRWTKTQVDTVAAIKDAELVAKRYELERLQTEFQIELATKEAEIDAEMREVDAECGELRVEVQRLEIELSEIKEQRKRNLLSVRSEIASSLREMEQKEIAHATQIRKLQEALAALTEKHKQDIENMNAETDNALDLIDIDIQRLSAAIERSRNDAFKSDEIQSHRMSEATSTIEMLRSEIAASHERAQGLREEAEQARSKLGQLEQDLFKAEERSHVLAEQLSYAEEQKRLMKNEIMKLDRSLWNTRKTTLLQ